MILQSVLCIWFLLFSEFLVLHKIVIQKLRAEVNKQRKLDFFFSSTVAPLQGKIVFYNWTNNRLGFSISLLN